MADVFGESQFLTYTGFGVIQAILCTYTAADTGRDTRKLIVCVLTSFVMLDCPLLRTAVLSKRYCVNVLPFNFNKNSIILHACHNESIMRLNGSFNVKADDQKLMIDLN